MRRRLPLMLVAWLAVFSLPAGAQQLPITTFTTANGLPHFTINRIVRDSRGLLWFCTGRGLSRFDGYEFTSLGTDSGLPDTAVTTLLETRRGAYWVGTAQGLFRFDPRGRSGTGSPLFQAVAGLAANGAAIAVTAAVESGSGEIWVGAEDGLYLLKEDGGRTALRPVDIGLPNTLAEERRIWDVLEARSGTLWIAAPSGLYRRDGTGATSRFTTRDGLPDNYLHALEQDRNGDLWAGTRTGGIFRFTDRGDGGSLTVDAIFSTPDLPTPWVFDLFEGTAGSFWIGSAAGLVQFTPGRGTSRPTFRAYSMANGLSYFDITTVTEDLAGNLWLGTNNAGAMRISRSGFTSYGDRERLRHVYDVFEDRLGRVCLRAAVRNADDSGYRIFVGCFVGQRFDGFPLGPEALTGWVQEGVTVQTRSGEWWLGTGRALLRFPAAAATESLRMARPMGTYTLAAHQAYRVFEDGSGHVWASSTSSATHGLARWDPVTGVMTDMAETPGLPSLKGELARAFEEDASGSLWIGFDSGLARFSNGRFRWFGRTDGLPGGPFMDIHRDRTGTLWLASREGGLIRVDQAATDRPTFTTYSTAEGLSSDDVYVITEDRDGYLYIGGGRGLDRLEPQAGRFTHFAAAEGVPAGRFLDAFCDRQGVLWFAMSSGLVRFDPPRDRSPVTPSVWITGLRVAGVLQPVSVLGDRVITLPDLTSGQNSLQIDFVGLGGAAGDTLHYQYQLAGADRDWTNPVAQRTVTYASLSPGRYTFRVRAVNSAGGTSEGEASVAFVILSPVWRRWWFVTLGALATGLTVYGWHRYRLARVLELANLRTRIATDLHDDIGADLTRIVLLSEVAQQTADIGRVASIARIARESVSAMSDIVWAIDPRRESLSDLVRRMRQHAEEVFLSREIGLQFEAGGDEGKLGVDVRREVLLVFKEAVNNAVRHSRCSQATVRIRREGSRLSLTVADNGVGFETARESTGRGLGSLRRRAERLRGTLDVASGPGAGTAITLSVPLA